MLLPRFAFFKIATDAFDRGLAADARFVTELGRPKIGICRTVRRAGPLGEFVESSRVTSGATIVSGRSVDGLADFPVSTSPPAASSTASPSTPRTTVFLTFAVGVAGPGGRFLAIEAVLQRPGATIALARLGPLVSRVFRL